jgi:glycosyltransferase involved in cell wall biosynthesis
VKFSVLLPTRDRPELLRYAIESVRRQDYQDWEIIVSDNASSHDVAPVVNEAGDARIRLVRTREFLPVTDNWNHALEHSSGDYVVMLGDDDALLPGYFSKLAKLLAAHRNPDLVYVEAVQYAYPGVIPGEAKAFVQTGYCEFMKGRSAPFALSRQEARQAVDQAMDLRLSYSYNMQHSLVSRAAIRRLAQHGSFFQSPYPDYYATNVLLLTASSILVVPEPLVAIGISPKSFGFYYFNNRESDGTAFLNNFGPSSVPEAVRPHLLPGNALITCWFVAMACIERNFGAEYGVRVDPKRYRFLQVLYLDRRAGVGLARALWGKLKAAERLTFAWRRLQLFLAARLLPKGLRERVSQGIMARHGMFPLFDPRKRSVECRNILELFETWSAECRLG